MAAPISSYKPEYNEVAIRVLEGGESLAAVCCELDISRATLYKWRDDHPEFAEALAKGLQKAQRDWERLGKQGIEGDIKNFQGSSWIFTMKNRFRADYAHEAELLLGQNERLQQDLKALRAELNAKNERDH